MTYKQIQHTADRLSESDKREAETIARKLFGCYDYQGMLQQVEDSMGMAQYINRAIIRKIKPEGANWLVGERQYLEADYTPRYVKSTYYIKRL